MKFRKRPPWWVLTGGAVIALAILQTATWIAIDRTPPAWDQSHYLDVTLKFMDGWRAGGPRGFLHQAVHVDPSRGPVFPTLMMPLFAVLGPSQQSGLTLTLFVWPVLLLSTGAIAAHLAGKSAGLLAMLVCATIPLLVGLSHNVLIDMVLVTLTTLGILLLLVGDDFASTRFSAAFGLVVAIGVLTKVTFATTIALPLTVTLVAAVLRAAPDLNQPDTRALGRRRLGNVALALVVPALVAGTWYVRVWRSVIDYVQSASGGALAIGAGPENPITLDAITKFTRGEIANQISVLYTLAFVVAVLVGAALRIARLRAGSAAIGWAEVKTLILIASWVSLPFLLVAVGHQQDPRHVGPMLPALAVIVGCLVMTMPWAPLRRGTAALICLLGVVQVALTELPRINALPEYVRLPAPASLTIPLDAAVYGYNRRPDPRDAAAPIISYLEAVRGRRSTQIGVMQEHRIINPNTFNYLADLRGDPFTFSDPPADPSNLSQLAAELASYDFALYIPATNGTVFAPGGRDRVAIINQGTASVVLGDRLYSVFSSSFRTFPLGDGRTVQVLQR